MISIRPFIAIRPSAARVREFTVARLDHAGALERAAHASRSPGGLPALLEAEASRAKELVEARALIRHPEPTMFVHRQVQGGRTGIGLFAMVEPAASAAGAMRPHRRPRSEHAPSWSGSLRRHAMHADPVVIGFDCDEPTLELLEREMNERPLFHVVADDGATHTMWAGTRAPQLMEAFRSVHAAMVLEGHHRLEGVARGGAALAMFVPFAQVRARASLALVSAEGLDALRARGASSCTRPESIGAGDPGSALVCTAADADPHAAWHRLPVPGGFVEAVASVASGVVRWHAGPVADAGAVESLVRGTGAAAALLLPDPELGALRALSASGAQLPAASTWFEPRFRSGLCMAEATEVATTIPE